MNAAPVVITDWRKLIIPAYGPTMLVSIGYGAITPLVALSARDLGASVGTAALVVALLGVGQLIGDLPAGALAARTGEKRALTAACLVDSAALLLAFLAQSLIVLALAVFVAGLAAAVFGLARHAYLTTAIPYRQRARALSSLGGTFRIGSFLGPFIGAGIVTVWNIGAAYGFAALTSLSAAALTLLLPELQTPAQATEPEKPASTSIFQVLARHRRVLYTLGLGVLVIQAARASRLSIIPLWAQSQGLHAAQTSLIFGISAAVDMLLFYPGGAIMDRFGRVWVAVPTMIVLGFGFLLLPFAHSATNIAAVAALMGLGNGLSAGIVMTLGADASPMQGRAQFLGGWRLCADTGTAAGPLVISAVSLFATLALASWVLAAMSWLGTGWLIKWVPAYAHRASPAPGDESGP